MSLFAPLPAEKRRKYVYGASTCVLVVFIGLGVFAKNGWLPSTDALTGKKTGWFGKDQPKNAASSWNPLAAPLPAATPQLSKEYIYAGQRLLAVEDANANAAPPADLAVWRPSTGNWYVIDSQNQVTIANWGGSSDIPVPGDFDGDGKTDFSVYRPSDGNWYILRSSDGTVNVTNWGTGSDIPTAADFDGDGRTDAAIYRSPGGWIILQSSNGQALLGQWGNSGDIPVPADYDGDGKADIAVWRPSNTTFYAIHSSDGQLQSATFGSSGDTHVCADYDGDGKADFALFDPSINTSTDQTSPNWYILQSTNNTQVTYRWGTAGDSPVQNDYDGDGKVDLAVWRPTNGHWYIRKSASSEALREENWGIAGDIPVPANFRR